MSQPTPYARQFDFTGWSTSRPNTPHPGVQIDAELNAVRAALNHALTNLALIQRDDTGLANGVVGIDQLSAVVQAMLAGGGFTVRGNWAASTAYLRGDIVADDGKVYLVITDHNSSVSLAADIASGYVSSAIFEPHALLDYMDDLAAATGAGLVGSTGGITVQAALDLKAALASPTFTGTPAAPTAALGTDTTQIATTAFVQDAVQALLDAAPGTLDTLNELAAALGDDANFAATTATSLGSRVQYVTSRANLAAAATTPATAFLTESGREGIFVWSSSNNATNVTNDPGQGVYVPPTSDTTGASGAWVRKLEVSVYNVKWFGAAVDNSTDDVTAVNRAVNFVNYLGGGIVFFPVGTTLLGTAGSSIAISLKGGVYLLGCGTASVLKLKNSADSHLVNVASGVTDCGVLNLCLDGNRANQTASVHTLRVVGVDGLTVDKCLIRQAFHYGIGMQGGTNKHVKILNTDIEDTGGDGIDIKNNNDDNEDVIISNVTVRRWGLNGAETIQTAIDCRGKVQLSNIDIREPDASDAVGIRFRPGELTDTNGLGGHKSALSNFHIDMGSETTSVALSVPARDVQVSNGYITGGLRGVVVQDSGFRATNVIVEDVSDEGWLLDADGSGLDADDAILTNCSGRSCGDRALSIETDNCQIIGFVGVDSDDGIVIDAGADGTRIIGGRVSGNTTNQLSNSGTNTIIRHVAGYVTENFVESASLALDSTGSKTAVIAHGLAATPDLKKCSIVHIRETAVSDHVIGFYQIDSVDATNITVRARVTVASATGGATFRLGVTVRV